jgi:hypothetical protein
MDDDTLNRRIDERAKKIIATYLKTSAFTDRKLTDTPTDSYQVVPRGYVTNNGLVANRPNSSVATVGQPYLATDTNIPMTYTSTGWRNGVGSVVAST